MLNPWFKLIVRYLLPINIIGHLYRFWCFRYHSTIVVNGSIPDRIIYLEQRDEHKDDANAKPVDPRNLDGVNTYP